MAQEFGQALGLVVFAVAVGWVLLLIILNRRLYGAYVARYGDRRRWWQRLLYWPPDGSWLTIRFYVTPYDDPVVERLRRRILITWSVPFWIVFLIIAFVVFREDFLPVVGIYFGALFVALIVTGYRFEVAYLRHYRGLTGWPLLVHSLIGGVPWIAPWRPVDTFHQLDEPEVERLRRRHERVWRVWFLSLLIPMVLFVLFLLSLLIFVALG